MRCPRHLEKRAVALVALALLVGQVFPVLAEPAAAVDSNYTFTEISPPPRSDFYVPGVVGINNRNQVVGNYFPTPFSLPHAFLWDGYVTDLGALGGSASLASGINDRGQVVGDAMTVSGDRHAFLWESGKMTDLGTFSAIGINNRGQIVGQKVTANGQVHAIVWEAGTVTDLGTIPGGSTSSGRGINYRGQVVGQSTTGNGQVHAFLWEAGVITDLGTLPGGTSSDARAINDRGQVVGCASVSSSRCHAFLWQDGVMTDLGLLPGGDQSDAKAINNRGQVVGTSTSTSLSRSRMFLWQSGAIADLGLFPANAFITEPTGINESGVIAGYSVVSEPRRWTYHPFVAAPGTQPSHSLSLDGTTGYAEVPSAPALNLTGDWTAEAWFKDEDPAGFNHDYRQILMKGDRLADPEAPYFALVGRNHIIAGVRTGGVDYPLSYDLTAAGLTPGQWHHVAVSFDAAANWLDLWLNGKHLYSIVVPSHSTIGNTLPLEIGRNGPSSRKYWLGKLADIRIWNVARSSDQITANFQTELSGPQPGLIANWHFNEASGTIAADSSGNRQDATLAGRSGFSFDVHP